ncbi:anthranilate synthase component II [Aliikangiella maris]|uniref:Aminodeoxychorismate/anthranilate synthase component II n=2 Tax=Aliikangiella maris TaxID=3162458 RepID=A0ABV2BWJ1_9GAMM
MKYPTPHKRILMVDNYDSFTFNLVHYLQQLNAQVVVKRNDELSLDEVSQIGPSHIVISPGPKTPSEAGLSLSIIEKFQNRYPILGVCLGHQAIGQVFGGKVIRAKQVMHGKTSAILHNNQGIFNGLPQGFRVTRYHSLVLDETNLPDCLQITAWTENSTGQLEYIMGIRHKTLPIEGVQFHPESVLSEYGLTMLEKFLMH